jgi:hypothetical protein
MGSEVCRRKYHFSDDLRVQLMLAYREPRRRGLTARLDELEKWTRWPRHAFKAEALRLGITRRVSGCPWTAEEEAYVAEMAGTMSVKRIAKHLRRSVESVETRARRELQLRTKLTEGYTLTDLQQVFGVSWTTVKGWYKRGLLGKPVNGGIGIRVYDRAVVTFIRRHYRYYDLRAVDQTWFKAMVFSPGG